MRLAYRIVVAASFSVLAGLAVVAADPKPGNSPHADALGLVLNTQADEIRKAEAPGRIDGTGDELWWHDTKERTWVVKRPFSPGSIDSTHLFVVTYRIEGKDAAEWLVDTRKGSVSRRETKAK